MSGIWAGVQSERRPDRLDGLRQRARDDLAMLGFPAANWVPPTVAADGRALLDVLVVGGGFCGQTVAYALRRDGIANHRVVDQAPRGLEGPWATYARMEILRSPKHLTGPDLGVPSLTFRAWYEAQHGREGWERLHKIGRLDWRDYLLFVRDTVGVTVESEVAVTALRPRADAVEVELARAGGAPGGGTTETVLARHVVLATGRDGAGCARRPTFPGLGGDQSAAGSVHHAAEAIDMAALAGRRIAILGGQATAFDCAASALEAGAAEVVMFVRRRHLPQVNKSKGLSYPGALRSLAALSETDRWRLLTFVFAEQTPPPWESVARCDRFAGFSIRFACPWRDVEPRPGGIAIITDAGAEPFDRAILATGFDVDLARRPELAGFAPAIKLWRDAVDVDEARRHPDAARFPLLGPAFELQAREAGAVPGLERVRLFNWGVTVSHGAVAGDIPGLRSGVERLLDGLSASLLAADREHHWRRLRDLEDPELKPTRLYVPPAERDPGPRLR